MLVHDFFSPVAIVVILKYILRAVTDAVFYRLVFADRLCC
jgi:hypothetical protein